MDLDTPDHGASLPLASDTCTELKVAKTSDFRLSNEDLQRFQAAGIQGRSLYEEAF
jgi:hypothetical protein